MTYKHIVIVTGAGMSVESGIRPFRGPDGVWQRDLIDRVATPGGFHNDAAFAHEQYNAMRRDIHAAMPNEGHLALARLAAEYPGKITIITQNVDDLHSRAQANHPPKTGNALVYIHGELLKSRKMRFNEGLQQWEETGETISTHADIMPDSPDVTDGRLRSLRPDTVWFGEAIKHEDVATHAINDCDLYIAVGTSGHIPPANMFPYFVKEGQERHCSPARTIEVNPYPTGDSHFDEVVAESAATALPKLVNELLKEAHKSPWAARTGERTGRTPG